MNYGVVADIMCFVHACPSFMVCQVVQGIGLPVSGTDLRIEQSPGGILAEGK